MNEGGKDAAASGAPKRAGREYLVSGPWSSAAAPRGEAPAHVRGCAEEDERRRQRRAEEEGDDREEPPGGVASHHLPGRRHALAPWTACLKEAREGRRTTASSEKNGMAVVCLYGSRPAAVLAFLVIIIICTSLRIMSSNNYLPPFLFYCLPLISFPCMSDGPGKNIMLP